MAATVVRKVLGYANKNSIAGVNQKKVQKAP
jgi:hypothetical protein